LIDMTPVLRFELAVPRHSIQYLKALNAIALPALTYLLCAKYMALELRESSGNEDGTKETLKQCRSAIRSSSLRLDQCFTVLCCKLFFRLCRDYELASTSIPTA
jgi:hypothetical protein